MLNTANVVQPQNTDSLEPAKYVETVKNARFARAYVPNQVMKEILTPEEALRKGTLFPELVDLCY